MTPHHPSLLRHGAAMLYDTLLVLPIIMLSVAIGMALAALLADTGSGEPQPLHPSWVQLLGALTIAGFYCVFWRKGGQTLGMQAWRIHLVTKTGGKPTLYACSIRLGTATLSLLCLGVGFWWSLLDPQHRYWHDIASGTRLELRPKQPAKKT